ncbi:TfoX/Sxy family protein [Chitinophaga vietnamensis]|uniref:TfoX/Sxy family protein n=1 Tax=Chitinophaga vietnamensis TaxID=2593957 RepID=UPI0011779009|nr:TfoX/Sxy family protein [Chitinophaga vietnamensis]
MAINEALADKVRELIAAATTQVEEKKMFGGLCFMVDDKMCIGVRTDTMMVRLDPVLAATMAEEDGVQPMVHSGKVMPGFLFVDVDVLKTKKQVERWVKLALEYNKVAKASKKKK